MNHGAEMDYQVRHAKPHVGHVDLSSLAFKQACSLSPWQEVQRALRNLSNDPNVHVIVLSGSGGGIDRGMQECIATILQCVKREPPPDMTPLCLQPSQSKGAAMMS